MIKVDKRNIYFEGLVSLEFLICKLIFVQITLILTGIRDLLHNTLSLKEKVTYFFRLHMYLYISYD